jgi:hypothetical protein
MPCLARGLSLINYGVIPYIDLKAQYRALKAEIDAAVLKVLESCEYVLGSDDFKARVAKSKFRSMPNFAKFDTGFIALQGDHGSVSFRNIKIRAIPSAQSGS